MESADLIVFPLHPLINTPASIKVTKTFLFKYAFHHEITGVGVTLIGNKGVVIPLISLSVLMLSIRFKYWWALYIIRFLEVGVILQ